MLFLRLSRIHWWIRSLTSVHVTVDSRPEHASRSLVRPLKIKIRSHLVVSMVHSIILPMEQPCDRIIYHITTQCHNPEDRDFHVHCRENDKSRVVVILFISIIFFRCCHINFKIYQNCFISFALLGIFYTMYFCTDRCDSISEEHGKVLWNSDTDVVTNKNSIN